MSGLVPECGRLGRSACSCPLPPSWEPLAESRPGGSVRLAQGLLARSEGAGPHDDEVIPLLGLGDEVLIQTAVLWQFHRPSDVGFDAQLFPCLLHIPFFSYGALVPLVC